MPSIHVPVTRGLRLHHVVEAITIRGMVVPGLRGEFYRRNIAKDAESGVESIGIYALNGEDAFAAWGNAERSEYAFHSVRSADGSWGPPQEGSPDIRVMNDGERVIGLIVTTGAPSNRQKLSDPAEQRDLATEQVRGRTRTRFFPCRVTGNDTVELDVDTGQEWARLQTQALVESAKRERGPVAHHHCPPATGRQPVADEAAGQEPALALAGVGVGQENNS